MTQLRAGLPLSATLALMILAPGTAAFGQEDPARGITLGFSQGLEFSDNVNNSNPASSGAISRTGLDFEFFTETRSQSFTFSIGTDITGEFGSDLEDDFDLERSRANMTYVRSGANSSLRFSADYSETNLDEETLELGDGSSLVIDSSGQAVRTRVSASLQTGIDGPLESTFTAQIRDLEYQDTIDPDLEDQRQSSFDALIAARLSPAMTLRGRAGVSNTDEDDAIMTEREESFFGIGLATETASGLSVVGDVLYDSTESMTTGGTTEDDGLGFELGIRQDRPDGALILNLASRIDNAGRRTSAEVGRNFETKTGVIGFSLGVVDQESEDDLQIIGSLNYERELSRGAVTASLVQDANSRDGTAFLNTRLTLGYAQAINALSDWRADLSYAASEELGADDDDERTTATFTYSRELTEEWRLNTGMRHVNVSSSGSADRSSNSVFFNIGRDITFGF